MIIGNYKKLEKKFLNILKELRGVQSRRRLANYLKAL